MAVVSVKEAFEDRRSSTRRGVTTHTRSYYVVCNNFTDGPAVARTADDGTTAIPSSGDTFPGDSAAYARRIDAEPHDGQPDMFIVRVEYTDEAPSGGGGFEPNPLLRPPAIRWGGTSRTEAYFKDVDDKAVVNSAGVGFDEMLVRETGDMVVTITRNQSTFDVDQAIEYLHVTNSDSFTVDGWTIAAEHAKMGPIQADKHIEGGIEYYQVQYPIKLMRGAFDDKLLDVGYDERTPTPLANAGDPRPIVYPSGEHAGERVSKPYPLDEFGQAILTPDPTIRTLTFKPYVAKSFGVFNFS